MTPNQQTDPFVKYELTKQIHKLLPQIGKEIEVKNSEWYFTELFKNNKIEKITYGHKHPDVYYEVIVKSNVKSFDISKDLPAIQAPQIRQILVALQEVLGLGYTQPHKTKAQALCQRWLDGLHPLFHREPETVLQELVEVLEKVLENLKK